MTLKFDERMPRGLHIELVNWLQTQIYHPRECTGLTHTRAFLSSIPNPDAAIEWLAEHGGYCDCEVIMNTNPAYGIAADKSQPKAS